MYQSLLVALDLDCPSDLDVCLPRAIAIAQAFESSLKVMTVVPTMGMSLVGEFFPIGFEKKAAAQRMELLKKLVDERLPDGMSAQHIVSEGTIYESVLNVAEREKVDLIVLGAYRPELSDFLLGPNAARIVRHAKTSVLVVR